MDFASPDWYTPETVVQSVPNSCKYNLELPPAPRSAPERPGSITPVTATPARQGALVLGVYQPGVGNFQLRNVCKRSEPPPGQADVLPPCMHPVAPGHCCFCSSQLLHLPCQHGYFHIQPKFQRPTGYLYPIGCRGCGEGGSCATECPPPGTIWPRC